MCHDYILHDRNIDNVNNINSNSDINNIYMNSNTEQNKFSDLLLKQNIYLYKKNLDLPNNINNNYYNSSPYFKQNNNNLQINKDKILNANNRLIVNNYTKNNYNFDNVEKKYPLINLSETNKNKINNKIITSLNSLENSLTNILCNKNGINQIKNLLKNKKYNTDLIRKIILILNKENGLQVVFKNIYGNYFIQHLFPKMNSDLIQLTIDLISSDFANIAKTPSGTHCLQELLNYINDSEKERFQLLKL